jgi:hypothetical protein
MSHYTKIDVAIKDVGLFKRICAKHNVTVQEHGNLIRVPTMQGVMATATLTDMDATGRGSRTAYLAKHDKVAGASQYIGDNDVNYNSLARRLGKNGGILMRDYSEAIVKKSLSRAGAMVTKRQVNSDGSIVLKVAVNG